MHTLELRHNKRSTKYNQEIQKQDEDRTHAINDFTTMPRNKFKQGTTEFKNIATKN